MLDVTENGSPIREMRGDAHSPRRSCATSPGSRCSCAARRSPATPSRLNYTLMEPFGVVGRIVPFNHPLMFAAGKQRRAADRRQHA